MEVELLLPEIHEEIFFDASRFKVINAGRRFGKSLLLGAVIIKHLNKVYKQGDKVLPNKIWYIAPTYRQAKEIFWTRAKEQLAPFMTKPPNESELKIYLLGGAEFTIKGSDKADRLRGSYLTLALMDEAAYHKPGVWENVVRPMLGDVQGDAVFASSPDGYNEFYNLFQRGASGEIGWRSWQFPSVAGGFISESEVESAKVDMTEDTWRQEFMAEFVGKAARVYYQFNREKHIKQVNFVPELEIDWMWDFNIIPCVHSALAHRHKGIIHIFDEICVGETPDTVREFMRRYPKEQVKAINLYGDYTGNISTTGITDYQIMERMLVQAGYPKPKLRVYGGNPIERDRTNAFNTKLMNAAEQIGIYIAPHCTKLIKDLEQVKRSDKTGKIDKGTDPMLSHISDSVGYFVYVEYPGKWTTTQAIEEKHKVVNAAGWWV